MGKVISLSLPSSSSPSPTLWQITERLRFVCRCFYDLLQGFVSFAFNQEPTNLAGCRMPPYSRSPGPVGRQSLFAKPRERIRRPRPRPCRVLYDVIPRRPLTSTDNSSTYPLSILSFGISAFRGVGGSRKGGPTQMSLEVWEVQRL